jgi:hypothetical protein
VSGGSEGDGMTGGGVAGYASGHIEALGAGK